MISDELRKRIVDTARNIYANPSDDDIEVDADAKLVESGVNDEGNKRWWVQAWVYVREEDLIAEKDGNK